MVSLLPGKSWCRPGGKIITILGMKRWFGFTRRGLWKKRCYLEKLKEAPAGNLVSIYFFLGQIIRMQQFRNQALQLCSELWGHVWQHTHITTALSTFGILLNTKLVLCTNTKDGGGGVLPLSCPWKEGLVATFKPGWGNKKQEILVKHEWMCSLTVCSSSCWASLTLNQHNSNVSLWNQDLGTAQCIYYHMANKKKDRSGTCNRLSRNSLPPLKP